MERSQSLWCKAGELKPNDSSWAPVSAYTHKISILRNEDLKIMEKKTKVFPLHFRNINLDNAREIRNSREEHLTGSWENPNETRAGYLWCEMLHSTNISDGSYSTVPGPG